MIFKPFAIMGLFAAFAAGGTIISPTSGSYAIAGQPIPFNYSNTNRCHAIDSPITVYLLDAPPAHSDITDHGEFTNFLYFFGRFSIPNFGLPPMTDPPPPPPTLTIPNLGPSVPNGELFFSVIETIHNCPPDGHDEFDLSYVPIEYYAA
ncbi:hypothetical protein QCA50_001359 [Cerrena zonata]|uniref:Uncharacterized protein n=1 Tax=Cerrena zonata TaxID=2478898 RepID=A0AAW0GX26_9APHY